MTIQQIESPTEAHASIAPRPAATGLRGHRVDAPTSRSRPLRVLLATPRYFPFMGGVETHVYEVARRLVTMGADVTVLTTDPSGNLPANEQLEGVKIRRVGTWSKVEDFYFAPEMYSVITRGEWDVVHCQGIHTFVPPLAMFAAWKAKIPYVVTFHTGGHSSRLRNTVRGLQWKLLRPLLARAERLVGVSRFEAKSFRKRLRLPGKLFTVIPNGSNLPDLGPEAVTDPDQNLILSVGRLESYKGHHRIIAAMPHLLEARPDLRLRILGTGPYEKTLNRLAEEFGVADKVQIGAIAATDRQGMASLLASASLIVLLSEYEAHPIAVMEALAAGRPVLGADTSGVAELAERGLVSTIPLNSSAQEVAAAVLHQLEQPHIPPAVQLPTWDGCANSLLDLYSAVAVRPESTR